jgi:uncharacterized membrane protein (UPF0136 family)
MEPETGAERLLCATRCGSPIPEDTFMIKRNRPADITALSLFFLFGALLCAASGIRLLLPGAELHPILRMFPALVIMGTEAVSWLVFLFIACVVAALGLWRCSYWGFISATVVLILFLAIHFLRALFTNNWLQIPVILVIGALLIWYLRTRAHVFAHPTAEP